MQIKTQTEMHTPADFAYTCLLDYKAWLELARERGAEIVEHATQGEQIAHFTARFTKRGRPQEFLITVTPKPENCVLVSWESKHISGDVQLSAAALKNDTALLSSDATLKPQTITARALFKVLSLAKGRLEERAARKLELLAVQIQNRYDQRG